MKTKLLILSIFIIVLFFGQDSINQDLQLKSALVTFNPSKVAKNTNGINLGVMDAYKKQRINGINIQANPITLLYLLIPKAIEISVTSLIRYFRILAMFTLRLLMIFIFFEN